MAWRWVCLWVLVGASAVLGCTGGEATTESDSTVDVISDLPSEEIEEIAEVTEEVEDSWKEDVVDVAEDVPCTAEALRCSASGHSELCLSGTWVLHNTCSYGCEAGECLPSTEPGTCGAPIPLALGQVVIGNTADGFADSTWSQSCTGDYYGYVPSGPELVYALTLTEATGVTLTLEPQDATYFGVYLRGDCASSFGEYHDLCAGSESVSAPIVLETTLGPGTHHIFVDDFGDGGEGPGEFKLSVQGKIREVCYDQVPRFLDLSEGSVAVTGDTNDGTASTISNEYHCPNDAYQTSGNEVIYQFTLSERAELRGSATPLVPADSRLSLYVRSECDERLSGQVACAYTEGESPAVFLEELEAGNYYLFVDDFSQSVDTAGTYLLELELQ